MDHRSKIVTIVKDTCIVCQENKIEQTLGETREEYGLPGENRTQVDMRFYGMYEKCLKTDYCWDLFDILMLFY